MVIRKRILIALIGIANLFPAFAKASCTYVTGGAGKIMISLPGSLTIPRDAANGTVIYTSTSQEPSAAIVLECSSGDTYGASNNLGAQAVASNTLMPITNTGLSFRWIYDNAPLGPPGSNTAAAQQSFVGTTHAFQLVKTGIVAAGATVPAGVAATWDEGGISPLTMNIGSPMTIVAESCTTPNVTVSMGQSRLAMFSGVGSTTAPVSFSMALNNCPAGLGSIQYQFSPTGTVVDVTNGVISLTTDSTATGIGLKLTDSSGAALKYNDQYPLSGYDAATGGSYTVALKAAYYQTSATVAAGTANAVLTFTITYQ